MTAAAGDEWLQRADWSARASEFGELSIDSTPYATITIDGRPAGVTPLLHASVAAGHHRVRLSLRDGRSRDVDVDVPAGKAAAPVVIHW